MLYLAYGPLGLTDADLWSLPLGELSDRIEGWRYRQYLRARERAQLASWLLSALVKTPPSIDEFVGIWDDGEILGKMEHYRKVKNALLQRKGVEMKK